VANLSDAIQVQSSTVASGFLLESCTIGGNTGSALSVGTGVSDFTVKSNMIGGSTHFGANAAGVFLSAANDHYIIEGNNLRGNTGLGINGHAFGSATKVVRNNLGHVTQNSGTASGLTSAAGEMAIAHGLAGVPTHFKPVMFGGAASAPLSAHIVSMDATNVVVKVFSGTSPLVSGNVTVYWEASL
jgi:hypothetical protein